MLVYNLCNLSDSILLARLVICAEGMIHWAHGG